jgi:hypothetical protein
MKRPGKLTIAQLSFPLSSSPAPLCPEGIITAIRRVHVADFLYGFGQDPLDGQPLMQRREPFGEFLRR